MKKSLTIFVLALFSLSFLFAEITVDHAGSVTTVDPAKYQTRVELWGQMDNVSAEGGVTAQDFETANDGYDAEGADDFSVTDAEGWTIDQVMVLGSFSAAGPCPLANVRFYADDGGMPGELAGECLDATVVDPLDPNLDIIVDPPIYLAQGDYWVSVQGRMDYGEGGQWYWSKQVADDTSEFYWRNPGDGFGSGNIDWVYGSVQWPDNSDFNLSVALYGDIGQQALTGIFNLNLVDSFGDGWNGGFISVSVNGEVVIDSVTIDDGAEASFDFEVTTGDEVFCDYTEGSWSYENEIYVYNNLNMLVASSGEGDVVPEDITFTAEVLNPVFGNLSGTVTSAERVPIEGAVITIDAYTTVTDASGMYLIEDIVIGTFDVVCDAYDQGYIIQTLEAVILDGETTVVDFMLDPVPDGDTIEFPFYVELTEGYYVDTGSTTPFNDDYDVYGSDNNDVVYILDVEAASTVGVSLLNSAFDTKLSIYADGVVPGPENYLFYNDDWYGRGTEEDKKSGNYDYRVLQSALMDIVLLPGTYVVIIDGFGTSNGDYEIEVTVDPLPSIYDIQFTEDPSGDSPALGDTVTVTGIVTASNEEYAFFLQDDVGPWNGIYCYLVDEDSLVVDTVPVQGDEVLLTAVVDEYYNLTELKDFLAYELVSSGNALPEPYVVATGMVDESMESVLAQILVATCVAEADNYGESQLDDGSGVVFADDMFYDFEPVLNGVYNVVGPFTYSFGEYKILPRDEGDIEDLTNELLWPPMDLGYVIDENDILLDWIAPTQYGWNTYYPGPQYFNRVAPERATLYNVEDFGFSYPMDISAVDHTFYDNGEWGEDTDFTFKIYDTDGATLLYESAALTAGHWATIVDEFDPITVTDDFWVAIAPVVYNETTMQGAPFSLGADTGNNHGYAGEPGAWEPDLEHATTIYIMGGAPLRYATSFNPTGGHKAKNFDHTALVTDIPENYSSQTRALLGFNVYRNGEMINAELVTAPYYDDMDVAEGVYTYYATAVWHMGESEGSNEVTATLAFGDLSGTITDSESGDPIEGAVITAGSYGATSDAAGYYLIEGMLIGTYDVTAAATLYEASDPVSVEITDGGMAVADFALVSSGGGDIYFFDDFEGDLNWTFDEESDWGITDEDSYSPDHSMHESPGGNYAANQEFSSSTLTVPWDLSGVLDATLSYWYKCDIETGFDWMKTEITSDGETWLLLATYDIEDMEEYVQETIALGGFVGAGYEAVQLRFRFYADGGYEVNGMYIDDVLVTTSMDDFAAPFIVHAGPEFYEGTDEDYVFTADIVDVSGIAEANVVYTLDGVDETTLPFTSVDGTTYTFTIPAQDAGVQVDYAVEATDASVNSNEGMMDGYVYIAGSPFIYDNGVVDFYTTVPEGTGAAVKIVNPAGFQLNLAYALIRNYTDQSGQDNDDFEFHVWADDGGVPGADLITPFIVSPEASYENTSAMTRIDLRDYAAELTNIVGDFYIGFLANTGGEHGIVHCTITQPGNFANSYTFDGANWVFWDGTDLHFRAVAELIPTSIGTVEGVVTRSDNGDALEGVLVSVGSATGLTEADGSYSIIADPGTQTVTAVLEGYNDFSGSVVVVENDVVDYDFTMSPAFWAPSNLTYTYNPPNPNVVLQWDEPAPPVVEEFFEGFEGAFLPDGWNAMSPDGGSGWAQLEVGTTPLPGWTGGEAIAAPDGGDYMTFCTWDTGGGSSNDQWLVTPGIEVQDGAVFSFHMVCWYASSYMDNVDILLSTTVNDDVAAFDTVIDNLTFDSAADEEWAAFNYTLTDFAAAGTTVYIAFNENVADNLNDGAFTALDNVAVGAAASIPLGYANSTVAVGNRMAESVITRQMRQISNEEAATRELTGYNVYRDGELLGTAVSTFYLDAAVPGGIHEYYVTATYTDPTGESGASNVVEVDVVDAGDNIIPLVTELTGNYPNPFNPATSISFAVSEAGNVTIDIYNVRGEKVKTLIDAHLAADFYSMDWNGTDDNQNSVSSGVYFYKMKAGRYTSTKKMILMK